MIAAVYARKSNDEGDKSEDAKSVTRQLDRAREYAACKGWTLGDRFVYIDDGISGAEFIKRPGFNRLMESLSPRPPFDVLIVSEQSRLGRDTIRTLHAIQQITDAGVRVFSYLDDREISLEEDTDEIQEFIRGWSSSQERKKASQRTRDAARRRAERGEVAGGRVLGYTNVRPQEGAAARRAVNEAEARIVRRIFQMTADGKGMLKIAKMLNAEGVKNPTGRDAPRAKANTTSKRCDQWAATGVREVLRRELYLGHVVYGKRRWEYRKGKKVRHEVPESEWIKLEKPELRIVSDELWQAAQDRIASTVAAYPRRRAGGRLNGKPSSGLESKYLLSGFLRCGICGGNLIISKKAPSKRGRPQNTYVCSTHRARGIMGCPSRHGVSAVNLTREVLTTLKRVFWQESVLTDMLTSMVAAHRAAPEALAAQRTALAERISILDVEIKNLTKVAKANPDLTSIAEAIREGEQERREAVAKLEHLDGLAVEGTGLVSLSIDNMEELRQELEGEPGAARQVLKRLLLGPITVTPRVTDDGGLAFEFAFTATYAVLAEPRVLREDGQGYEGSGKEVWRQETQQLQGLSVVSRKRTEEWVRAPGRGARSRSLAPRLPNTIHEATIDRRDRGDDGELRRLPKTVFPPCRQRPQRRRCPRRWRRALALRRVWTRERSVRIASESHPDLTIASASRSRASPPSSRSRTPSPRAATRSPHAPTGLPDVQSFQTLASSVTTTRAKPGRSVTLDW